MNIQKIVVYKRNNKYQLELYKNNIKILETTARIGKNGFSKNKVEGDGKTPVGVFKLGKAFGIGNNINLKKNYLKVTKNHYWVDDSNSKYYNELIDITKTKKDWNTAEHIVEFPIAYEYALEIEYNKTKNKNRGSAIFLHCDTGKDTLGCISVERNYMINILQTIEEGALIIIGDKNDI